MKKILCLLISLMLMFTLAACGNKNNTGNNTDNGGDVANVQEETEEETTAAECTPVYLNQLISCDGIFDMTLTSVSWKDTVKPSNTSDYYSYYKDKKGEKYIVIKGTIKNTSGSTIDVQFGSESMFKFNDKYEYAATWTAEGEEHDDFYGYQIKPLTTANVIFYASVPDEIKDEMVSGYLKFGFDDLTTNVYDFDECTHKYQLDFQ